MKRRSIIELLVAFASAAQGQIRVPTESLTFKPDPEPMTLAIYLQGDKKEIPGISSLKVHRDGKTLTISAQEIWDTLNTKENH